MGLVSLSGADTISLNNRLFTGLADGDCIDIKFANDIANVKAGKNGNTIYALNEMGKVADLMMRLMRGSDDDKFMLGLLSSQFNNFAAFPLMIGQFTKKLGDGAGNVSSDIYILSGGVFTKQVEVKDNVEGDVTQSVAIYTMKFSGAPRVIG